MNYCLSDKKNSIMLSDMEFDVLVETVYSGVVNLNIACQSLRRLYCGVYSLEDNSALIDPVWDSVQCGFVDTSIRNILALLEDKPLYTKGKKTCYRFNILNVLNCLSQRSPVIKFDNTLKKIKNLSHYKRVRDYRHAIIHPNSGSGEYSAFIKDLYIISQAISKLYSKIYGFATDVGTSCGIINSSDLFRIISNRLALGDRYIKLIRRLKSDLMLNQNLAAIESEVEKILNIDKDVFGISTTAKVKRVELEILY
jgi:hypothetical protein